MAKAHEFLCCERYETVTCMKPSQSSVACGTSNANKRSHWCVSLLIEMCILNLKKKKNWVLGDESLEPLKY